MNLGPPPPPPPPNFAPPPPSQPQTIENEKSAENPIAITDMIKERFDNCGELNDFHRATRAGDRRKLDMLAVRNPEIVNSKDHLGRCALWISASVRMDWTEETLTHLCQMPKIDIDQTDVRGQTPLFAAVKYNHVENAEILLRHGANPNGSNIHTESPVHIAVRDGFYDIIEVLLKYGANPNGSDEEKPIKRENFGTIPLYTAIIYDQFHSFLLLLRHGANPNLLMEQPGFSDSLIEGLLKHDSDLKWLQALFAVGMSPYQSIPDRYANPRGDRAKLIEEIKVRKRQTSSLKLQARKVVRQNIPTKNLLQMPLKVPTSISRFLKLPELDKL